MSEQDLFFSFISLVPDEIKTSALTGDTGYDTYLRDAHRQVHNLANFITVMKNCLNFDGVVEVKVV